MLRIGALRAAAIRRSAFPTASLRAPSASFHSTSRFKPTSITPNRANLSITQLPRLQARFVANSVAGKPASDDLPHAILNAREEAKHIAEDFAKIIAGSNYNKRSHDSLADGFTNITVGIASEVPKPILITGLAGTLPYIGTAVSTLWYAREAGLAASGYFASVDYDTAITLLEHSATIQVTYGAVILSFLGAVHWGLEFAGYGGQQGYRRLLLGAAPVLYAWPTLALSPEIALVTQWVGFTTMWWADLKATDKGWTPVWYSQYRFYLSLLVGSCIIATLGGETFFNPFTGGGINLEEKRLVSSIDNEGWGSSSVAYTTLPASSNTREHLESHGKITGTISGSDIELVEGEDYYVVLHKKAVSPEQEEKEEDAKTHLEEVSSKQDEMHEDRKKGKAGDVKRHPDD